MSFINEFILTAVRKNTKIQSKIEMYYEYRRKKGESALYILKYKHNQQDMYLHIDTADYLEEIAKSVEFALQAQISEYEYLNRKIMKTRTEHKEFIKKLIKAYKTEEMLKDGYYNNTGMIDLVDKIYQEAFYENKNINFQEMIDHCIKTYTQEYMIEKYHEEERRKEIERNMVLDRPDYTLNCAF